jgi:hypothetical protein
LQLLQLPDNRLFIQFKEVFMGYVIPLDQALRMAAIRHDERLALLQADLNDLFDAGCIVAITAEQLLTLEESNLLYNFETGLCEDFTLEEHA